MRKTLAKMLPLVKKVVRSDMMNLPLDDAVEANFTAFKSVINALDGVDVNIDKAYIVKQIKKETHGKVNLKTGAQLMNGEEALAYVRTRKADTDLLRGQRQMQVLKAIERKMKTLSAFPKYEKIASILGDNMKMTMSFKDAIGLYPLVSSLKSVETLQLKGSDYQPGKVYYLKLDEPYLQNLKQKLRNYLGINK
ncbi:LCP family protein [Camelliibacillus cellulosilyticus]|uniref:LCP family protein n=1 Tax=Camelliibacillus cellulosilyticus TaxID=2174486 RepID=A0ABV9GPH3_9BACL